MADEEVNASPWDVFINLLAVIALYASVWALLAVLFSFTDLAFPDPLDSRIDLRDDIRYALAVLIIFFPAYVWSWRAIELDLVANPDKRRRWLRTCPIYLTLFLAGMLALGDLSCLVYYFLTGELTVRFILKVVAIAIVAGSTFWFYLHALRRAPGPFPPATRLFAYACYAAVAIAIVAGFAVAGSPRQARLQRLDNRRLEDLADIQRNIVDYWQRKRVLPASLDRLNDDIAGFHPPTDPETNRGYDYRATSSLAFELCADFARSDHDVRHNIGRWGWQLRESADAWNHDAGHYCFTRTIDPTRYPLPPTTTSP